MGSKDPSGIQKYKNHIIVVLGWHPNPTYCSIVPVFYCRKCLKCPSVLVFWCPSFPVTQCPVDPVSQPVTLGGGQTKATNRGVPTKQTITWTPSLYEQKFIYRDGAHLKAFLYDIREPRCKQIKIVHLLLFKWVPVAQWDTSWLICFWS